jgi:hypothetical protein
MAGLDKVAVDLYFYVSYEKDGLYSSCFGNTPLDVKSLDLENFTNFDDITEEKALQWLFSSLGEDKNQIEFNLQKDIKEWGVAPRKIGLPSNW